MKSVIASVVLLVLLIGFCLFVKTRTDRTLDDLYAATEAFPTETASYQKNPEDVCAAAETLGKTWSDAVVYFSYVCGYNVLNRADQAVWEFYAAVTTKDYPAAVNARYQLLDALRRMRELEGITLSSIF